MIEVVCGVIRDGRGRYLACRRPQGKHLGGLWEFPGGKMEAGEEARQALVRELEEELGIVVETGEALTPVEWDYGSRAIRLWPFICSAGEMEPVRLEHDELRWCEVEELAGLNWAPADVPVVRELVGPKPVR